MSDLLKQLRHESDIFRKCGTNGRADLLDNAADLIERQEKRIAEMERELGRMALVNSDHFNKRNDYRKEADALAAYLLLLRDAAKSIYQGKNCSGFMIESDDIDRLEEVAEKSPTTSLTERDAEVARKVLLKASKDTPARDCSCDHWLHERALRVKRSEV